MSRKIKVVELFSGAGGFRVALQKVNNNAFKTIWSNQWNPFSKTQFAYNFYNKRFPDSININENLNDVWQDVPEHDFLVGRFPDQDLSVIDTTFRGVQGKQNILWWSIYKIISKNKPKVILLENLTKILSSPSSQKGRNFAIILRSLNDLGYVVEWKTINSADYGFPQKRKRVFIYAYLSPSTVESSLSTIKESIFENSFPSITFLQEQHRDLSFRSYNDLKALSNNYNGLKFYSTGISVWGKVFNCNYNPSLSPLIPFSKIMETNPSSYKFLTKDEIKSASYEKSSKSVTYKSKDGKSYTSKQGKMSFPESINDCPRTTLTTEGSINRSSHFYPYKKDIRFITPLEAERMNGFPDNWTIGIPSKERFHLMGNSIVIGVVEKIILEIFKKHLTPFAQ